VQDGEAGDVGEVAGVAGEEWGAVMDGTGGDPEVVASGLWPSGSPVRT
jgi:hypothetical protein